MAVKKYPKLVQCDRRGQIVIPKDVRRELKIDEGTGFWMYTLTEEGILLKKIESPSLAKHSGIVKGLEEKSEKLKIKKKNIRKSLQKYKKTTEGGLDVI